MSELQEGIIFDPGTLKNYLRENPYHGRSNPQIKERDLNVLNREDITPEDIETEAPLFGDGLGLDSIDALELIVC